MRNPTGARRAFATALQFLSPSKESQRDTTTTTRVPTMSNMDYEIKSFTPAEMARMARERKDVIVMENTYDRTYAPLPSTDVGTRVRALIEITRSSKDADDARRRARDDPELKAFGDDYRVLFDKLTTPEFVADPVAVRAVERLVQTRAQVERGELSAREAEETAASVAVRAAIEETQSRVQEEAVSEEATATNACA